MRDWKAELQAARDMVANVKPDKQWLATYDHLYNIAHAAVCQLAGDTGVKKKKVRMDDWRRWLDANGVPAQEQEPELLQAVEEFDGHWGDGHIAGQQAQPVPIPNEPVANVGGMAMLMEAERRAAGNLAGQVNAIPNVWELLNDNPRRR